MDKPGLVNQPSEVLAKQLMQLSPIDLVHACSINTELVNFCNDSYLWRELIKRDIPTVNVDLVENPKAFYLNFMLFTGEIYHNGQLVDNKPFNYRDTLNRATELAGALTQGKPYIIVYTRAITDTPDDEDYPKVVIEVIWLQQENVVLPYIAHELKINRVDIIDQPNDKWNIVHFNSITQNSYFFNIEKEALVPGTIFDVTLNGGVFQLDVRRFEEEIPVLIGSMINLIKRLDEASGDNLNARARAKLVVRNERLLRNPKVYDSSLSPQLTADERRQEVLNRLLETITEDVLYNVGGIETSWDTYEEFVDAQTIAINALSDGQIQTMQILQGQLSLNTQNNAYLYITKNGRIMLSRYYTDARATENIVI